MSHLTTMLAAAAFLTSTANAANTSTATAEELIGKQTPAFTSDRLTPEALWAMGRIGEVGIAPKGNTIAYGVTYYSVKQNKSCTRLHTLTSPPALHDASPKERIANEVPPSSTADAKLPSSAAHPEAANFGS